MGLKKPKKKWVEISLPVSPEIEDALSNFLFELGAAGSATHEDILKAYVQDSVWTADQQDQLIQYLHQLNELSFFVRIDQLRVQKIEDQDWNAIWKQSIQPIEIGSELLIKPSWISMEASPNRGIIEIDPQMAFGTGTHATTQVMLKFIIKHIRNSCRIIDIGTGTGILAIAAALFSDAQIIAFDNDAIAAATARQNVRQNHILDRIHIFCGTLDAIKEIQFDLILANINRSTIVPLFSDMCAHLRQSGLAILSGILIEEKREIKKHLLRFPFTIIDELQMDEWIGFVIQKV